MIKIDRRKGDRHKLPQIDRHLNEQRSRSGRHQPRCWSTEFAAVDGEGWTDRAGHHQYVLLGSNDAHIYNPDGLDWQTCFDFLISLSQSGRTLVAFAFGYDFTMMVKHLNEHHLTRLWKEHETWLSGGDGLRYHVQYYPSKRYQISRWAGSTQTGSCLVYDVFGFFQSSFVKALEAHHIGTGLELRRIRTMKERRGSFSQKTLKSIQSYNRLECKLLVELMTKIQADVKAAGLRLSGWHGAGAVARSLLDVYHVKEHLPIIEDRELQDAILRAYFGGRIELIQPGYFPQAYGHDLRSAYPWAATQCLDFSRGEWRRRDSAYTLCRVRWKIDKHLPLAPFPFRRDRRIHWANGGEGWYWHPEVIAAQLLYGDRIEVIDWYSFFPTSDVKPFSFLADVYEQRQAWKREGNDAQKILKLGMNAIYGKMAQASFQRQKPAYQSYVYAGLITSYTRGRVLSLAAQNPKSIIAFATDGVFSTSPLKCDTRDEMGLWETSQANNFYILQSGLYCTDALQHTRGFRPSEINWQSLKQGVKQNALGYHQSLNVRRFVGLAGGASRGAWAEIGEWLESQREVSGRTAKLEWRGYLMNLDFTGEGLSDRYVPKGGDVLADARESEDYWEQLEQPDPLV